MQFEYIQALPEEYIYDWTAEEVKFGPLRPPMNRASDDEDEDDLSKPEVRRAFLSQRMKEKAKIAELKGDIKGVALLVKHREIAREDFDALYPPYEMPGVHVQVSDINE